MPAASPWRIFLLTSISLSTMSTPPNDPFLKSSYSLEEEGLTRLPSPMPQSANVTSASLNMTHPSSAPPILTTPSSTIPAADTAMQTTGKIKFCPSSTKSTSITHRNKVTGSQVGASSEGAVERSQQVIPISSGLHSPRTSIVHHQWPWYRHPEFLPIYFSIDCFCHGSRADVSGYWNDCCLWDTTCLYKADIEPHQIWSSSWSGWRSLARSCWLLATVCPWFIFAPNLSILFLITLT